MGFLPFYITTAPVCVSPSQKLTRSKQLKVKILEGPTEMQWRCIIDVHIKSKHRKNNSVMSRIDSTMDFPFLTDQKTIQHVQHTRTMFVMRGLPGSGKSTIVRNLQSVYPESITCSADDHFLVDGVYTFDMAGLKDAHMKCQQKARKSCEAGTPVVIIDNTNVRRWEMKVYFDMARHNGYIVVTVQPKTAWRFDPEELARRNKHGVGVDILRQKVSQFDTLSPVYFGWFLTSKGSKDVIFTAKVLFHECLKKCQRYRQSVIDSLAMTKKGTFNQNSEEELVNFFPWPSSRDDHLLHCTAKFCNKGRAPGATDYINRPDVNHTLGKSSNLQITGFIFSNSTVGARLRLNREQLGLFDKPEEKDRDGIIARNAAVNQRLSQMYNSSGSKSNSSSSSLHPVQQTHAERPSSSTLPSSSSSSSSVLAPPVGFGRSAHITVCTGQGIRANQTLYDSLDVCDIESRGEGVNRVPVMGGMAADLGGGFCAVYLYKPISVSTLFSAYYV